MSKLDNSTIAWKKKRFDEVAVIANGQVDPRIEPYCQEIHIGPENIESHTGRIINLQKAEELGLISGKYVFDENSIIYSKIRPNLNKLCQPSFRGICSADMYPIWAREEINKSYLYYFMQSPEFYNQAIKSSMRTGIPKINRQDLNRIKITYPVDHAIQNRIVNTISVWDNAIEKTEALIAAKEKQFEGVTQKLFEPNHSWKPYKLGELFDNRKEANNTDLPLVSITREKGVIPHSETNRKDNSSEDKSKYLRIRLNDIGYNTMRMWQGVSALSGIDGIVSPAYTICIPKKIVDPEFMAFLFKTKPMIHKFYRYSQGLTSDTWNLKFHHFCEVKAEIPDIETQVEIAQILNTAKHEISLLKKNLEHYRSQKRGLMQKLLTGEWQVSSMQPGAEGEHQELTKESVA